VRYRDREAASLTSLCTLESKYVEQWNDTANPALLRILAITELQLVRYLIGEQRKRSASEEAQRLTRSASDEQ